MQTYIKAGQSTLALRVAMLNVEKSLQEIYSFKNNEYEKHHEKYHEICHENYHENYHEKKISNEKFVINGVDKR
jgi:hypothetical protein